MSSLYDELAERLAQDPSLMKRGGPRVDISMLLFGARDDLRSLWLAAERTVADQGDESPDGLREAVERLRPIFGDRTRKGA